jgi:hypothetical protein
MILVLNRILSRGREFAMKTFFRIPMLLLLFLVVSVASASALPLPVADFGGVFSFNTTTGVINSTVRVTDVVYKDGSFTTTDDAIIGAFIGTDFSGWNFDQSTFTLAIDSGASNSFSMGDFLTGTLSNYAVSELSGVNGYQVNALLSGMIYDAQGSVFIEQFEAATSGMDLAQVISFEIYLDTYGDTVLVNSQGKVAPVPEPATMLLLGSGLASLAVVRRQKARKA